MFDQDVIMYTADDRNTHSVDEVRLVDITSLYVLLM